MFAQKLCNLPGRHQATGGLCVTQRHKYNQHGLPELQLLRASQVAKLWCLHRTFVTCLAGIRLQEGSLSPRDTKTTSLGSQSCNY